MAEDAIYTGKAKDLCFRLAKIADEDENIYDLILHKEKRSLSQNSYYWVVLGKVADKLRISKNRLHNQMLRDFGQIQYVGDKVIWMEIPDTDEAEEQVIEATTYHLKPTSRVMEGKDGITYRVYVMMRGSHEFNTREMTVLLDGLLEEARQLNIEVLPPDKLAEMRMLEEQAEQRRKKLKEGDEND